MLVSPPHHAPVAPPSLDPDLLTLTLTLIPTFGPGSCQLKNTHSLPYSSHAKA